MPDQKCRGGPGCPACCNDGYTGEFCSACADGYYRARHECKECPPGDQTVMLYVFIASFVAIFNGSLFFLHYDIMMCIFDTICTLQVFRAIGIADGMSIARVRARPYPRNRHAVRDAEIEPI